MSEISEFPPPPGFLNKRLRSMPFNRGFVWNNVAYWGQLEDDGKDMVFVELKQGERTTHVWTKDTYFSKSRVEDSPSV